MIGIGKRRRGHTGRFHRRIAMVMVLPMVLTMAPVSLPGHSAGGGDGLLSAVRSWLGDIDTLFRGSPAPKDPQGRMQPGAAWSPPGRSGEAVAAERPKPPGKRVKELADQRTNTRTVYQLDDGRVQSELSSVPLRYRDAAGKWRDIDTRVVALPDVTGGFVFGNDGTGFATRFGTRSDALVRVQVAGRSVTLGVPGPARRIAPRVAGSTVTYAGVWDGADLVYDVTPSGPKGSIVLSRAPAADASFAFTVRTAGVTAKTLPDGSIGLFASGASVSGAPLFVFPKPFMVDAKRDAASPHGQVYSSQVTMTATAQDGTTTITVKPDQGWLAAKDRAYPVVIDPTITVQPDVSASKDAMIVSYAATSNYGTDPRLGVGVDRWGRIRSVVQFNLAGIVPAGTPVDAAELSLYQDNTVLDSTSSSNPVALEARAVAQNWTPSTVTWNSINAAVGDLAGTATYNSALTNSWTSFPVTGMVRDWLAGTRPNYGFMFKAANETQVRGGPIFWAGEFPVAPIGSWPTYATRTAPKLTLTFGLPAVTLPDPQTVRATGAELSWSAYVDPPGAGGDDLVEYQVHRSTVAEFAPSAATLVAPVPPGRTSYVDTTATPDTLHYYRVLVVRKDGQQPATQALAVKTPPAGYVDANLPTVADTTITACEYTLPHDVLYNRPLVGIGYVPGGYGVTRGLIKWDTSSIPSTARITQAEGRMWRTMYNGNAAYFATHLLTRDFDETATWLNASTGVPWTNYGGDAVSTAIQVLGLGPTANSVWVNFNLTNQVQGWLANPASNKGILIRQVQEPNKACVGNGEGATFVASEGDETSVRPQLHVRYTDTTATYYAAATPTRLNAGETTTVPVTITNTTAQTWPAASTRLGYWWKRPDGSDATGSSQLLTAIPSDLAPGQTVTVTAQVKAPPLSGEGNKAEAYTLAWDLYDTTSNNWKSSSHQLPQLPQQIRVEDPTSDLLGLEKFYSYAGKNTGAGGAAMNNLYAGNTVWSYNALSNPSRGLSTFVRMAYNSLDTSASSMGFGWSLQTSTIQRLGSQLSFHPPGQKWPTQVRATDGDGTTNVWVLDTHGSDVKDCTPSTCDYTHPRGVHLYLQQTGSADPTRAWVFTRPDRTQFFFDEDGFQSAIVDKNGNTQSFTYERRKSNNKPTKFLRYITDPAGRRTLTLDYYDKGEATYPYVDDTTWQDATGTNLTNPFIVDSVKSITDISGRKITFTYTLKGLMAKMVDGDGSTNGAPKTFRFAYDMTQGNKNVKLIQATDPRGHSTKFAYYTAPVDPQNKWKLADLTDRLGGITHFDYVDPDGPQGGTINTTVTDAELNKTLYQMDNFARPYQLTNAKNEITKLTWDGDHNVKELTEANNAVSTWEYDPKTGYPLTIKDAEAVKNNWPGTTLDYTTSLNGYIADLAAKTSPEGRKWQFGYDARGNLTTVTDPVGATSVNTYDTLGQLFTAKDANGNVTTYGEYHPSGYPQTITDALTAKTTFGYDDRGNVTELRNAKQARTTQTYDTFGRPLDRVEPVDAAANRYLTTRAPVYDVNDNITTAYAANGTSTTSVYDKADQAIESLAPKDEATDPERKTTTTYDKVGNILTETEPQGNLTPTAGDHTTTTKYDAIYQPIEVRNGLGQKVTSVYDNVGNLRTLIDAKKNATADPADFTTKYEYDLNHRITKTIDAADKFTTARYDRDGLVVGDTDAEGNETLSIYNPRGDLVESKVPYSKDAAGNITYRISKYEYDQVGNQTKFITPRGVATTDDPDDFVQVTVYDELNREKEVWSAYDEDDARYNKPDKTIYEYDAVGNQTRVSAPPSEGQTVRNDTVYTYYDNGWQKTATDPWNIVNSFDYNDLGQQTKNTLAPAGTTATDAASRTMTWDYYPSGNQKARSDDGLPVGRDVVLVDSSDSNNTASQGAWTSGAATGQYGYDVYTADAGTGSAQFNWQLNIPRDGTYEVFVQYPQITGAATDAKFTVTHNGGSTTKTVNQTINTGTWVSLGSYSFVEEGAQKVTLTNQANGTVVADVVKLVRSNAGEADNEKKTFTYKYNANGLMTEVKDLSPNVKTDTYRIGYDQLNQVSKVEEFAPGATTPKNTTELTYDANGNLSTSKHNLTWSKVDYDVRDMASTVTNADSPTAGNQQISTFTYTARGDLLKQVKPNGNTVDFDYYLDGSVKHQVEKTRGGPVVAEHTLDYTANGNPSKDVLKLMNADNSADYIDNTYTFDYDPQDRVTKVAKTGDSSATEEYVYDGNSNVVSQTVGGVPTTNKYDRNRLHSSTTGGVTSTYNYDPIGRLDTVSVGGQRAQKYYYDGFDRTAKITAGTGATAKSTTYAYDPFDRTVSQTAAGKTTLFTYLALDELVLREDVTDKADKSYQYAPWGQQLTQIKHKDDGTREYSQFTYRPRGDVIAITKEDGNTRATYGYTAYGEDDDSQFTGADKPDPANPDAEPYNAFRFNASRWDAGSGTYDMGFRNYDPGLNRFLTRDYYGGAMADMNLTTDPYTNNRYSFAGGKDSPPN
jgi:RHS repeat-associated protein